MCAAMVDRNTDYSYQRQYSPQPYHNEPDIRTSAFVSNSDKLHAERQERLKWEMKREYEDHMRRPSPGYRDQEPPYYQPNVQQKQEQGRPVYYRLGTPEAGLPLGRYAEMRKVLDDERHKDYNRFRREKDEIENKRREELYRRRNQSPAKPQTELYDHNEMAQQLREERRKEYNDHMRRKQEIEYLSPRKPATPPGGGLAIGGYDEYRKRLRADRTREYRDSLLQQQHQQWFQRAQELHLDTSPIHEGHLEVERPLVGSPRDVIIDYKKLKQEIGEDRKTDYTKNLTQKDQGTKSKPPPTPPVGLDIPTEQERKRIVELKKRQYRDELLRQQKEQILNRTQRQLEPPVLDRRNQQEQPPMPDYRRSQDSNRTQRAPSGRWEPNNYRRETFAPNQPQLSTQRQHFQETGNVPNGPKSTVVFHQQEKSVDKKPTREMNKSPDGQKPMTTPTGKDEDYKNLWYGNYKREPFRKASPRLLSPPHQSNMGNEEEYHSSRRKLEHENRRKEYNDFLERKKQQESDKKMYLENQRRQPAAQVIKGDYYSSEEYSKRRQQLQEEEHKDYQQFLERPPLTPPELSGLPIGQFVYTPRQKWLEKERNREYNELIKERKRDSRPMRVSTPEYLQGLPLTQKKYDVVRKQREKERNREYNDYLSKKKGFVPVNGITLPMDYDPKVWNEIQDQIRSAGSDSLGSYHYNVRSFGGVSEMKDQFRSHTLIRDVIPEMKPMSIPPRKIEKPKNPTITESRFSKTQRKPDSKVYQSAVRSILKGESNELPVTPQKKIDTDRPTEYYTAFEEPRGVKDKIEKRANDYSKHWIDGIDMDKVKIFPQGEYEEKHRHLQRQWKDSFKDTVAQQREKLIKEHETREAGKFMLENAVVESPRCIPTGEYEIKQQQFKDQLREECKSFLKRHIPKERSKEIWKENEQPRTVPQSGEYKNRRERLQSQLRQDFLDFYGQQSPRKERKKEYSRDPPGAVLFDGEYKKVKEKVREERVKDYQTYLEKKQQEYSRRNNNFAEGNNTFFDSLGQSMDQKREQLVRERNDDYRRHLQEKREKESPSRYPPNSVRRQDEPPRYQSPPREQRTERDRSGPGSYQNGPRTPSYQDMLEDKRRQEASYRRYEPEFARSSDRY